MASFQETSRPLAILGGGVLKAGFGLSVVAAAGVLALDPVPVALEAPG